MAALAREVLDVLHKSVAALEGAVGGLGFDESPCSVVVRAQGITVVLGPMSAIGEDLIMSTGPSTDVYDVTAIAYSPQVGPTHGSSEASHRRSTARLMHGRCSSSQRLTGHQHGRVSGGVDAAHGYRFLQP